MMRSSAITHFENVETPSEILGKKQLLKAVYIIIYRGTIDMNKKVKNICGSFTNSK